jgi:hypothetical protein
MTPQSRYGDSYIDITEEALVLVMSLDPLEVIHLSHIFGLEEEQATKSKIREQALLQKGVLVSKSLFRLSRDEEDDNLRKHRHGYHATVRFRGDNSSVLLYVLSGTIRTNGQVLQLVAFDTRKQKQRTMNGTPPCTVCRGTLRLLDQQTSILPINFIWPVIDEEGKSILMALFYFCRSLTSISYHL